MNREAFAFNEFYYKMDMLEMGYPQFVFIDTFDVKYNEMQVRICNESRSQMLASFRFDRDDVEYSPDACINKIVYWCSNYIPQKTCCESRLEPKTMKPMTCEKCGAPLKDCECEYCGTRYYIPSDEYETLWADNVPIMQVKKKLNEVQLLQSQSQALQDVRYRGLFMI